jgi:ribosomal protein S13
VKEKIKTKSYENLIKFFKNYYGLNTNYICQTSKRIEYPLDLNMNVLSFQYRLFEQLFEKKQITFLSVKKLMKVNILILDFIWSYRGIRHFKGLPVRGQRT